MTTMAVEARDLVKVYPGGQRALDGVSFSIRSGEVIGIMGENGAGKTTLIKILCTLLLPTSGTLRVLGHDIRHHPVRIKTRLGVVSQDCHLDIRLSVRQNLRFHGRYFGLERRWLDAAIDGWLDTLGLGHKADEPVYRLSGGTKRRVMLAKAFLTEPDLLILDEPTVGPDPEVRGQVWDTIRVFGRQGKTVLLSTHHEEEARALCDRLLVLRAGRGECRPVDAGMPAIRGRGDAFRPSVASAP